MITRDRLKQSFSEGGAQEIYQEIIAEGDFLGFAREYVFFLPMEQRKQRIASTITAESQQKKETAEDYRVVRSALWGLTKASKMELSQLQVMLNDFIDLAMQTENSSVRRLSLNVIERLEMNEDDLRTDFLDFCIEHMASIEEFSGIQSVCMKLAYRMCTFYPELMEELKRTLEAMEIDYYKPAVKSVRSKILSGKFK